VAPAQARQTRARVKKIALQPHKNATHTSLDTITDAVVILLCSTFSISKLLKFKVL